MKSEILRLLRETEGYISGQELCDRFSVSRTAIWKVMVQLKDEGYQIEAVRNKGYYLKESPDVLNRGSILSHMNTAIMGHEVIYMDEIDSTNTKAKSLGEEGALEGTLVVADMQKSGKGRRGRQWESPKGQAIYMSLLLRPQFPPVKAPMLTLVMAYSIGKVLKEKEHLDVAIKWPNDLVVNRKKVCGILTEMSTEIDYINHVVIGVGINANTDSFPKELQEKATSLKIESKETILRARLVGYIMEEFEVQYQRFCEVQDLSFLQNEYNDMLVNCGKEVKVLEPGNEYEAVAIGINQEGSLLVRREENKIEEVFAGEVSVRGVYGYV